MLLMKKLCTLVTIFLFFYNAGTAQYVNIPDAGFRKLLKNKFPGCFNVAEQMDTTCSSILSTRYFIVPYDDRDNIKNIDGIQFFKNLDTLVCNSPTVETIPSFPSKLTYIDVSLSFITTLPALPNNLKYLYCTTVNNLAGLPALPASLLKLSCSNSLNTAFSSLPTLPPGLIFLDCSLNGSIKSLPALPNTLEYLNCSEMASLDNLPALPASLLYLSCFADKLSSLPAIPSSLKYLDCSSQGIYTGDNSLLTGLPALNANLTFLNCSYNKSLSSLPDLPATLDTLFCSECNLSSLPPLPSPLVHFACSNNSITNLPALPSMIKYFNCSKNQIAVLPELPASLVNFICNANAISTLPALPKSLLSFDCSYNNIISLPALPDSMILLNITGTDIYCLPKLPSAYRSSQFNIYLNDSKISCLPNIPGPPGKVSIWGNSDLANLKLCYAANNLYHCAGFPVINGKMFYDNNSNGIKDTDEPYKTRAKIQLSNGDYTFTDKEGYYEIATDSIGSYTITAQAPLYYNSVPASASFTFLKYDTSVNKNFALQPATVKDSLVIGITPLNWAARPGFSFPYLINYKNAGTTSLPVVVTFSYDYTKLNYDSTSNNDITNNGTSLSLNIGNFVPGEEKNFIGYFTLKTNAALGDTLFANSMISATNVNAVDSNVSAIRGSFDPNDKHGTPQLTPAQVAKGNYIQYNIRFQNTGTDTAFNIIISDTLSNKLQWNSFELLNASHPCKATIKDDKVYFEFLNILLPDSNINEIKSHGFVSFKIKPKSTVVLNDSILNKASIYFDYNEPVITNTVNTTISNLPAVYTFTGTGDWDDPSNWQNAQIPGNYIPEWITVVINPGSGNCLLNIPVTISKGAKLVVKEGKNLIINGKLTVK